MTSTAAELQIRVVGETMFDCRMPVDPIVCQDGFSVSVQASGSHRCEPRSNTGPYTEFELGFPSEKEELLIPYAENSLDPTNTVYSYVPIDLVVNVLEKHGGIRAQG